MDKFTVCGKTLTRQEIEEACHQIDEAAVNGTPRQYAKVAQKYAFDLAILVLHHFLPCTTKSSTESVQVRSVNPKIRLIEG